MNYIQKKLESLKLLEKVRVGKTKVFLPNRHNSWIITELTKCNKKNKKSCSFCSKFYIEGAKICWCLNSEYFYYDENNDALINKRYKRIFPQSY